MNILHIAPEWNWSKIFILPIAKCQARLGNKVWLSTPNTTGLNINDVNLVYECSWTKKYTTPIQYIYCGFKLIYYIRKHKINKVYTHTSIDSFIYILLLRLFTNNVHINYINHGVPFDSYTGIFRFIMQIIETVNILFSHKTITITKSMVPLLQKVNIKHKKLFYMSPGTLVGVPIKYSSFDELIHTRISMQKNNKQVANLNIIFVGRLERRKGLYELLEAINNTKLDCTLTILGYGNISKFMKNYNKKNIKFAGYNSNLSDFYLSADILCVPSHHEGFGQIYLEAASYGVIPICCKIPGPTDFVKDKKNGFCVDVDSSASIINLFDMIAQGEYDLKKIQKRAYESSLDFSTENVISKNLEIL